jgi:hypothetical protein
MSVDHLDSLDNPTSLNASDFSANPGLLQSRIQQLADQLKQVVSHAAQHGDSFDQAERMVWALVKQLGFHAMELFVSLQGQGDLGEQLQGLDDKPLSRSDEPVATVVRSIFGEHRFQQWVYSPGKNKAIALRPISVRMDLPDCRYSYLLQEFSQIICVESSFHQTSDNLQTILGGNFSVDTLEQVNLQVGKDADVFLKNLPKPDAEKEGRILVATADCKGVPLVKKDAAKVAAFETAKKRPGNRRMATVTSVYSVDPFVRTAQSIVEALFRDEVVREKSAKRPTPQFKDTMAHFPSIDTQDDEEVPISGIHEGMAWLASQVKRRRQEGQPLIVLMDGQASLWDTAAIHWSSEEKVEILDILHVAVYLWEAAGLFHHDHDEKSAFVRERLLRVLQGDVCGVLQGLRRMGSLRNFTGQRNKDLTRITGYFEKNQHRMRYHEYLQAGYPIASGVIEGACRHLVKDRMERSGMRWTLEGARSMLNVRAVFQSSHWVTFQQHRIAQLSTSSHPKRNLIKDYKPLSLAC